LTILGIQSGGFCHFWPILVIFGKTGFLGLVQFGFGPIPLLKRRAAEKTFWGQLGFWGFWGFGQKWSILDIFADFCTVRDPKFDLLGSFLALLTCFWGLNPDFDLKGRKLAIFEPCFGSCEAGFGPIWLNMAKSRLKKWIWTLLKLILTLSDRFLGSDLAEKEGFENWKI
jgi:hypothetical protein